MHAHELTTDIYNRCVSLRKISFLTHRMERLSQRQRRRSFIHDLVLKTFHPGVIHLSVSLSICFLLSLTSYCLAGDPQIRCRVDENLYHAVVADDIFAAEKALEQGAFVDVLTVVQDVPELSYGNLHLSPLGYSIRQGSEQMAMMLLKHGASWHIGNGKDAVSPFTLLLQKGNDTLFKMFIQQGGTVPSYYEENGKNLIYSAAIGGNVDMFNAVVAAGYPLPDKEKSARFIYLAAAGNPEIYEIIRNHYNLPPLAQFVDSDKFIPMLFFSRISEKSLTFYYENHPDDAQLCLSEAFGHDYLPLIQRICQEHPEYDTAYLFSMLKKAPFDKRFRTSLGRCLYDQKEDRLLRPVLFSWAFEAGHLADLNALARVERSTVWSEQEKRQIRGYALAGCLTERYALTYLRNVQSEQATSKGLFAFAHQILNQADYDPDSDFPDELNAGSLLRLAIALDDDTLLDTLLAHGATAEKDKLSPGLVYMALEEENIALMKRLLVHGADPNGAGAPGEDALQRAVVRKLDPEYIRLLLAYGADPNYIDLRRMHGQIYPYDNPLLYAIYLNHYDLVPLFFAPEAKVKVSPQVLGYAIRLVQTKKPELVKTLVSNIPDITDPDLAEALFEKIDPVVWALKNKNIPVLQRLSRSGASIIPNGYDKAQIACYAVNNNNVDLFATVVDAEAVQQLRCGNESVYAAVAGGGSADFMKFLFNGRNPKFETVAGSNLTLLHRAAIAGNVAVAQWLLDSGVEVDPVSSVPIASLPYERRSAITMTPLMAAAWFGQNDMLKLLLRAGADLSVQNKFGENALMMAARAGQDDAVSILLLHGADPAVKTSAGNDAFSLSAWVSDEARRARIRLLLTQDAL